jgi:hypothetical protein
MAVQNAYDAAFHAASLVPIGEREMEWSVTDIQEEITSLQVRVRTLQEKVQEYVNQ